MNPYPGEGFAASQGIPSPPPSPKYAIDPVPSSQPSSMQSWESPMLPTNSPSGVTKTGPNAWSAGPSGPANTGFPAPRSDLSGTIDIYSDLANQRMYYPEGQGGGQAIIPPGASPSGDDSWRDRIYADRAAASSRGSYVGGGRPSAQDPASRGKFEAIESPDIPKFQGDEYAPPEQDKGVYDTERRKAMGPGLRALREGTTEAISSAQSLDNPNARSKFIQETLHGYGQGLESVAAQAGREATGISERQHSRELDQYKTKYDYKRSTDLANYQVEINKIAADFAGQQAAHLMNYESGLGDNAAGATGAPNRDVYGPGNTPQPFMGYMT